MARALSRIKTIVVHCADTFPDMDIGVDEIRKWHVGRGWDDVGYHYVIRRDGTLEHGRSIDQYGAHVYKHNMDTIGICLVGGKARDGGPADNFDPIQKAVLITLVGALRQVVGPLDVVGHRDLDPRKTCPNFDAAALFETG